MIKEATLHILTAIILFLLGLALRLLPVIAGDDVLRFLPVLFVSLLAAVLTNEFFSGLLALLIPVISWLIGGARGFPEDYVKEALSALAGGLACGVFYRAFRVTILAFFSGVLLSRFAYGLIAFVLSIVLSKSFTLSDFLREAFLNEWPGLVLCLVVLPLLILLLRKMGIMFMLRDERRVDQ